MWLQAANLSDWKYEGENKERLIRRQYNNKERENAINR